MRALCALFALLAGCAQISGLDTLGVNATADATIDAPGADAGVDVVIEAELADVHDAGSDVVVAASCTMPSECPTGDVCCGTLATTGNFPQCQITNETASCKTSASCPTSITQNCSTKDVVRLCTVAQDCTESFYNKCCKFPYADASVEFCSNSLIADAAGGSCL